MMYRRLRLLDYWRSGPAPTNQPTNSPSYLSGFSTYMMTNILRRSTVPQLGTAGTCVHEEYRDHPPIIQAYPATKKRKNPQQQEKSMSFLPCLMAAVNTNILYLRV